jgi:hypothetical protein
MAGGGSEHSLSRPAMEGFLKASVLVLAACQPDQYADGPGQPGHFAEAMIRALGSNDLNYSRFFEALSEEMPPYQKPAFYRLGTPNPEFESQPPFTI